MSDTTHNIYLKFIGDSKSAEAATARVAKDANKLSKQQKKAFNDSFKQQKEQQKHAGPAQQKKATQEFRAQNKEHQATNRLLQQQLGLWGRIKAAAAGAFGRGGGGGGGGGRKGPPGFGAGFKNGMGFTGRMPSRYSLGQSAASGLRYGIGVAGIGLAGLATMPFNQVRGDYQAYFNNQRALGSLAGLNSGARFGAGLSMGGVQKLQHKMADWGYSPEETISSSREFARATGSGDYTERGMAAAKGLGLDSSEISSLLGDIRRGGGSFGEKGMKDFQRVLMAAVKGGVDASTLPEYLEGLKGLTSRASGAAGGEVSALPYAQLLAMFEKSGAAGLKGARGASVLSALDEGFRAPGGGDEGMAVVMGSLGYGRAGGNASYYEAKKMMQQGFSGEGGASKLKNLFDYVDTITGGGEESNLYMEGLMGGRLSLDQIETVRGTLNAGGSPEEIQRMLADMTSSELDVLHHIDDGISEFLAAGSRAAKLQLEEIDRGEAFAGSVEGMQDTFNHFLTHVMPHVADALEGLTTAVEFLIPGAEGFADASADIISFLANPTAYMAKNGVAGSAEVAAGASAYRDSVALEESVASLGRGASDADLTAGISTLMDAARLRQDSVANNPNAVISEMMAAGERAVGLDAESVTDRANSAAAADIRRAAELLAIIAERQGIYLANPGDIDTASRLQSTIAALGIAIPAGPRAVIDTTGGSP